MKNDPIIYDIIKQKFPNFHWNSDDNSNLYIGCKNYSLLQNNQNLLFLLFNCKNIVDDNNAPNYCVSSIFRRKKFYSQIKIAIFEVIILLLWNLYNYFSIELIYQYFPFLKKTNNSNNINQNDFSKKMNKDDNNQNTYQKSNNNQTITYKDINDKEIYDDNDIYEEEDEYEDEEEDNTINKEEYQKEDNFRQYKRRKISKKKMKTYKKKRKKNKYKEEIKNRNKYFDEEILNKDYFDNNEDNNDDDSSEKNNEEDEELLKINKNNFRNKEENKVEEKDDADNNDEEEDEEEEDDDDNQDYVTNRDKPEELRKKYLKRIRDYQYLQKIYSFLFGNYIDWVKNKIHHILIEIDKNINEEE
jgi:hypothetical protein